MITKSAISSAVLLAEKVYSHFLEIVVEGHVSKHRVGVHSEETRKKIEKRRFKDTRFIQLMTMSGKGGYSPDAVEFSKRSNYTNVTLLDHLLSVGRGAMIFYVIDCINKNSEMDPELLKIHLASLLSLGFMHDADKIATISRDEDLTLEVIQEIADDNGITAFCKDFRIELSAEQWLGLIAQVEGTQAHRYANSQPPPRMMGRLSLYVGSADKLDGIWLLDDTKRGGIKGVFERFAKDRAIEINPLENWKPLVLFDPHHPFLLDELQRWISLECLRTTGVPPLIETHHDGELCMLLPKEEFEIIKQKGLDRFCATLPFRLKTNVSNRGVPSLYNAKPKLNELFTFFQEDLTENELSDLFMVKYDVSQEVWDDLKELLDEVDVVPQLPNKNSGLVSLFASLEELDETGKVWLRETALIAILINLQIKAPSKAKIPTYDEREKQILRIVGQKPPAWIVGAKDAQSRRVLVALWIGVLADNDSDIHQNLFGPEGLLKIWLEGTDNTDGFRKFITGGGEQMIAKIRNRFEALLEKRLIQGDKPGAKGRCLFTAEPVTFGKSIAQADGLYEVKVSAFSGRDNRPESISIQKAHTTLSATSLAEHTIRNEIHKDQGGKKAGVPNLISSPSTLGLFGGLSLTGDKAMPAMSVYDLSRQDVKKGRVLHGTEIYSKRWRIARFERMPEKIVDQIDILRLLLTAALRIGRPLHLFRGLPLKQKGFFYFDAMPRIFIELLGSKSLRIEQIPEALEKLETARTIGETSGLGYDILTLYARQSTRFKAICLACGFLEGKGKYGNTIQDLRLQYEEYMKGAKEMSEKDGALVQLGRVAAGIQRRPGSNSGREERLVFNLCMDAAIQSRATGQEDRQSMIYAIAGELENNLVRKNKMAARKHWNEASLMDGCIAAAELFVDKVWIGALKGRVPSQKTRRLFAEIYRMSFLQTHRENINTQEEES